MGLDREAAEENAYRIERFITEEAFEVIKEYFDVWFRNNYWQFATKTKNGQLNIQKRITI